MFSYFQCASFSLLPLSLVTFPILQMQYTFGGLLGGISKVGLTPEQMYMCDFTNWHDEARFVKDDFMARKLCSSWTQIPVTFGPSFFLSVEKNSDDRKQILSSIYIKTQVTTWDDTESSTKKQKSTKIMIIN